MATLTVSLTSGVITGSKTYNLTDADVQTLIDYMANKYKPNPSDAVPNPAPLTPTQALLAWVNQWVVQARDEIRSAQLQAAQAAAAAQVVVPPIVFG